MANELEISGRTALIAKAMREARTSLQYALGSLNQLHGALDGQLQSIQRLAAGAGTVRGLEQRAEQIGVTARQTGSHTHHERWAEADRRVRETFGESQDAAGTLVPAIGDEKVYLEAFREDLASSSGRLDVAVEHLDKLDELPEYAGSEHANGLRTRLEHLKALTAGARAGMKHTMDQLEAAQLTATAFETNSVDIGESRHSKAIVAASEALTKTVTEARTDLHGLATEIYAEREKVDEGITFADAANQGREATPNAELAVAIHAAGNPTPQSARQVATGAGEQDPRHRQGQLQESGLRR
jgi:hypothetical protein